MKMSSQNGPEDSALAPAAGWVVKCRMHLAFDLIAELEGALRDAARAAGLDPGDLRAGGAHGRPPPRRLPGQRGAGRRQEGGQSPRGPWPRRSCRRCRPRSATASRSRSPGPGSSISRPGRPLLLAWLKAHRSRGRPGGRGRRRACRRDLGRRLQFAQHGQADARRPPALRRDRRGHPRLLAFTGAQGRARQPHRRLGHPVRQADLGLQAPPGRGRARPRPASRSSSASTSSGNAAAEADPAGHGGGARGARQAPGRRPGEPRALETHQRGRAWRPSRGSTTSSASASTRPWARASTTTRSSRCTASSPRRGVCRRRARAPWSSSTPSTPGSRPSPSSCASPTARPTTRRRTWRRSSTAPSTSRRNGDPLRRRQAPVRPLRAAFPDREEMVRDARPDPAAALSTSTSAPCSARTASR